MTPLPELKLQELFDNAQDVFDTIWMHKHYALNMTLLEAIDIRVRAREDALRKQHADEKAEIVKRLQELLDEELSEVPFMQPLRELIEELEGRK
jgi:hypothetical protein